MVPKDSAILGRSQVLDPLVLARVVGADLGCRVRRTIVGNHETEIAEGLRQSDLVAHRSAHGARAHIDAFDVERHVVADYLLQLGAQKIRIHHRIGGVLGMGMAQQCLPLVRRLERREELAVD